MTDLPRLSRRSLLALMTALPAFLGRASISIGGPRDQGIGGTGVTSGPHGPEDEGDRGIGGTGVIGTIRRFGSIVVNGLRIAYPKDVAVRIDDEAATARALKVGQVVRVVAVRTDTRLFTRRIDVTSEVVGRVEKASAESLTVLGQTVSLAGLPVSRRRWKFGDHVAVSGLRGPDGTIVASLVEKRDGRLEQIAGPVEIGSNGRPMVGGLPLAGVDPALVGDRAILRGRLANGVFDVVQGQSERALIGSGVTRFSIEAYVERRHDGLHLGSGLPVRGVADARLPFDRATLAVVDAVVGRGGDWHLESIRLDGGRGGNFAPGGPGGGRNHFRSGGSGGASPSNGPNSQGAPVGPPGAAPAPGARPAPPGARGGFGDPGGTVRPEFRGPSGFNGPGGPSGPGGATAPGFGGPGGFNGPGGRGGSGPPGGFGGPGGGR